MTKEDAKEQFESDITVEQVTDWLKKIGAVETKPLYVQLLFYLMDENEVTASDLADRLDKTISTIYNPLLDLEEMGILKSEKKGRTRYFSFVDDTIKDVIFANTSLKKLYQSRTSAFDQSNYINLCHKKYISEFLKPLNEPIKLKQKITLDGVINEHEMDFGFTFNNKIYGIDLRLASSSDQVFLYHEIGRITDIIRKESSLGGLILAYTFTKENEESQTYNIYKFDSLMTSLSSDVKILTIVDEVSEEYLEEYYYEKIANEIKEKINILKIK